VCVGKVQRMLGKPAIRCHRKQHSCCGHRVNGVRTDFGLLKFAHPVMGMKEYFSVFRRQVLARAK
jgi:hypothetical protein